MQDGDVVLARVLLGVSLSVACAGADRETSPGSDDGLGLPSSPRSVVGDEAAAGRGRSRISLGALGEWETRPPFYHVYMPDSQQSPEEISLSYSAVFANGSAVSLILPYAGRPVTFDAAALQSGRYGLMWSPSSGDMFSTRGAIHVEPTPEGIAVTLTDLVLTPPLRPEDSIAIGAGMIEGQLEQRCLVTEEREDVPSSTNGPGVAYVLDAAWSSDFCARQRR